MLGLRLLLKTGTEPIFKTRRIHERSRLQSRLEGVIAGETGISTVDEGLHYRGYSVEELATHSTFEETAYLILYGELPSANELTGFRHATGARGRGAEGNHRHDSQDSRSRLDDGT